MTADGLWDWPNQQVVRSDESGPGVDTVGPNPFITYGHDGLNYEFLVLTANGPVAAPLSWNFGDGSAEVVDGTNPATHTYAAAGTYTVSASVWGQTPITLDVTVEEPEPPPEPEPERSEEVV